MLIMQPFYKEVVYKNETMKKKNIIITVFALVYVGLLTAQEEYSNQNEKIVHGVYGGGSVIFGSVEDNDTYGGSFKVAYVANKQFEIGFSSTGLYTNLDIPTNFSSEYDLAALYGGLYIAPILFHQSKVNVAFPIVIGAGAAGIIEDNVYDNDFFENYEDEWEGMFVVEPGVSVLYNINRYVQLESGIKYRFTSKVDFENSSIDRVNGVSINIGIKVGVFDIGRNR